MDFIQPTATLWKMDNGADFHIARCARVCYASQKASVPLKFCQNLWKNNHRSMFRHAGAYYIIPVKIQINSKAYKDAIVKLVGHTYYVSTNEQAAIEYWDSLYKQYRISAQEAESNEIFRKHKLIRYTFCV